MIEKSVVKKSIWLYYSRKGMVIKESSQKWYA